LTGPGEEIFLITTRARSNHKAWIGEETKIIPTEDGSKGILKAMAQGLKGIHFSVKIITASSGRHRIIRTRPRDKADQKEAMTGAMAGSDAVIDKESNNIKVYEVDHFQKVVDLCL